MKIFTTAIMAAVFCATAHAQSTNINLSWGASTTSNVTYRLLSRPITSPTWTTTNTLGSGLSTTVSVPALQDTVFTVRAVWGTLASSDSNSVTNKARIPPTDPAHNLIITGGSLTGTLDGVPTVINVIDPSAVQVAPQPDFAPKEQP